MRKNTKRKLLVGIIIIVVLIVFYLLLVITEISGYIIKALKNSGIFGFLLSLI